MRVIHIGAARLTAEIAATASARACGLSLRDSLPVNHGMLFVYRDHQIREFWMKGTRLPLTIAFLDGEGRILQLFDMDPDQPERRYRSDLPARYALETHRGWLRARGIGVGDTVEFKLPRDLDVD